MTKHYSKNCHCHKSKSCDKSCSPRKISEPTTITKPGSYCVTRNIKGDGFNPIIVIESDNVSIDLKCQELDANGAEKAIVVIGHKNLNIKNGSVVNSSKVGVHATDLTGLTLEAVTFSGHTDLALKIINSKSVRVSGADVTQGNRAWLINNSSDVKE